MRSRRDRGQDQTAGEGSGIGHARELLLLNEVAQALHGSTDLHRALERTLAVTAELLGPSTGWVWLLDPETQQFYSAAALNLPPYLQEPVRMSGHWCLCTDLFRRGELRPTNIDVLECSRLSPAVRAADAAATGGLRYHASIPLYFQDRPLGVMNVAGTTWRRLTPDELRLLSTIAYQVGIAIERARLAEESTRLARAEERARIARDIHDTLAQGLTGIGLHIEGALRHLDSEPALARERLTRALDITRASLDEARRSVLDLRAAPLAGKPLAEALGGLARAFTSDTGVRVNVRATGGPSLPLRVETELFAIAQEALANVRSHADARTVEIALDVTGAGVRLAISDDGKGIVRGQADDANRGFGLPGMRERARLLGGTLRVRGRPGRGTTVVVSAPIGADRPPP